MAAGPQIQTVGRRKRVRAEKQDPQSGDPTEKQIWVEEQMAFRKENQEMLPR